jgi:hypothetical protein
MLWEGQREKPGLEHGKEEKRWAEKEFLGGVKGQVGKLGQLLSEYEEEREAERVREVRRERMAEKFAEPFIEAEEEDDDDDDDDEVGAGTLVVEEQESLDQIGIDFERVVREKFIYGLLGVRLFVAWGVFFLLIGFAGRILITMPLIGMTSGTKLTKEMLKNAGSMKRRRKRRL